jgi:hypothetical protein
LQTPLLDRVVPVPAPRRRRRTLRLLIVAALGVALDLLAIHYGWIEGLGAVVLRFLPCYVAVILVHELGHLAASRAAGLRFREFLAGPLLVRREAAGLSFRFLPRRILLGGQVQAVPEASTALRRRFLALSAGGPIATALVFAGAAALPDRRWMAALCLANLLVAAGSWLPYYVGGACTDAKAILLLSRGGPEGELLLGLLYVIALDTQGVRPKDWPAPAIASFENAGNSPLAATASVLELARAFDLRDPGALAATVERALGRAHLGVPLHRRMIFESAAYVQGVYRQNAPLATAWLDDARAVRGVVAETGWDADSLGAVAFAERRLTEARGHFLRALARLDRLPGSTGCVDACRARLSAVLEACDATPG